MVVPHCRIEIFLGILISSCLCFPAGQYCDFEEPCAWTATVIKNNVTGFVLTKANETERPGYDYSKNSTEGHYISVDSKIVGKNANASLISPWFEKSGTNCKLYFAFYRIGNVVAPVNVLKITHNYTAIIMSTDRIIVKRGRSSEAKWKMEAVFIGEIRTPFQIVFETVTESENAIVALDSIKLDNCFAEVPAVNGCSANKFECPNKYKCIEPDQVCDLNPDCLYGTDEAQICDKLPENARCTFESGSCGWTNFTEDPKSRWMIYQGPPPKMAAQDGFYDHTYKNASGHYIYFAVRPPVVNA